MVLSTNSIKKFSAYSAVSVASASDMCCFSMLTSQTAKDGLRPFMVEGESFDQGCKNPSIQQYLNKDGAYIRERETLKTKTELDQLSKEEGQAYAEHMSKALAFWYFTKGMEELGSSKDQMVGYREYGSFEGTCPEVPSSIVKPDEDNKSGAQDDLNVQKYFGYIVNRDAIDCCYSYTAGLAPQFMGPDGPAPNTDTTCMVKTFTKLNRSMDPMITGTGFGISKKCPSTIKEAQEKNTVSEKIPACFIRVDAETGFKTAPVEFTRESLVENDKSAEINELVNSKGLGKLGFSDINEVPHDGSVFVKVGSCPETEAQARFYYQSQDI